MGLFLRKSFRFGPVRLNLSKSGLGVSAGVKGARLGSGPRGRYVHAGRHGLYYRKQLASGKPIPASRPEGKGCASKLLILAAIGCGALLLIWLLRNPALMAAVVFVGCFIAVSYGLKQSKWRRRVAEYKQALDSILVGVYAVPSPESLQSLRQLRESAAGHADTRRLLESIEMDVYEAVLDQILDDGRISDLEAARIAAAESVLGLSADLRIKIKKDIFSAAYVDAIADHQLTADQIEQLHNLAAGLGLPPAHIKREFEIIKEITDAQDLKPPFTPLPPADVEVAVQKSEQVYLQVPAQVISARKSRHAENGVEYSVRRDGTLVLTQKRVLIAGGGNTIVRYDEIDNLDVDLDLGFIEITKNSSGRPTIIKTQRPLYAARFIETLRSGCIWCSDMLPGN